MINFKCILKYSPLLILTACGETKTILKGNKIYQYVDNSTIDGKQNQVIEYTVKERFQTKIKDKTDYYQILDTDIKKICKTDSVEIDGDEVGSFSGPMNGYYTNENNTFYKNKKFALGNFKYFYGKFALTAMTIPLKYRFSVGSDSLNPPSWETGFNVNFSPSYRLNWSTFNPSKKLLGNTLTNYSLTFSGLLGVGTADLKKASNAPGLLSDRKSSALTWGFMVSGGINSIGIGLAVGFDYILGSGSKYWVYQGKPWVGLNISVDLIK